MWKEAERWAGDTYCTYWWRTRSGQCNLNVQLKDREESGSKFRILYFRERDRGAFALFAQEETNNFWSEIWQSEEFLVKSCYMNYDLYYINSFKHDSNWRQVWTNLKIIRNDKQSVLKLYSLLILYTQKTQTSKYTVGISCFISYVMRV